MSLNGLNLLAADYNAGAVLKGNLQQGSNLTAKAEHGSESVNNLAQNDTVEQHEESTVDTNLVSKKIGSPTNIDGSDHMASGRATAELSQGSDQYASADYKSYANNNESQNAVVDQKEKVSTNLDVDVLGDKYGYGYGKGYGYGYGKGHVLGYDKGYGPHGYGKGYGPHGYDDGYGKDGHYFKGPDEINVDLENHMASSNQQSVSEQEGAQVAKSNHGSESINNLAQSAFTNQEEDISVNANVNVGGHGTQYGGPTVVQAGNHTASGNLNAKSSQSASQTAISDNGSWSVNNMSQDSFTHQNEKVGVYTNVVV